MDKFVDLKNLEDNLKDFYKTIVEPNAEKISEEKRTPNFQNLSLTEVHEMYITQSGVGPVYFITQELARHNAAEFDSWFKGFHLGFVNKNTNQIRIFVKITENLTDYDVCLLYSDSNNYFNQEIDDNCIWSFDNVKYENIEQYANPLTIITRIDNASKLLGQQKRNELSLTFNILTSGGVPEDESCHEVYVTGAHPTVEQSKDDRSLDDKNGINIGFISKKTGEISEEIGDLPLYYLSDDGIEYLYNTLFDYKVCLYSFEASVKTEQMEFNGEPTWFSIRTIEKRFLISEICEASELLPKERKTFYDYGLSCQREV